MRRAAPEGKQVDGNLRSCGDHQLAGDGARTVQASSATGCPVVLLAHG
jgi:hypothetical protein